MSYPIIKDESYGNFGGINIKASRKITGRNQVLDLVNLDLQTPGALTKRPGSTMLIGATLAGRIGAFYEYDKLDGSSQLIVSANTNAYKKVGGAWNVIRAGLTDSGIFDFVTFVDYLFATNGSEVWKYDGINAVNFSLPPGATTSAVAVGSGGTFADGFYRWAYGFLNDRGYYGPAINIIGATCAGGGDDSVALGLIAPGFSAPLGYGISGIVIYRGSGTAGDLAYVDTVPASQTSYLDLGLAVGDRLANDNLWMTAAPQSMELWNNQLFLVGFSALPSTVRFSSFIDNAPQPEAFDPLNFDEVRTNDGDKLTAAQAFGGQLVVCKSKSTHAFTGNNSDNLELREVSPIYGCISRRAITVFEQKCWYLDEKGICEFDGSDTKIVSDLVEPIFADVNLPVARELSQMFHVKHRNEVWCNIPTQGASFLNTCVVYDYDIGAWWTIEGVNASAMGIFTDDLGRPTTGFGDFSGSVSYFGASLMADNARGMTCRVRFPFKSTEESATEHLFRRFWLDLDPVFGGTKPITVNMYKNQGNSAVLSRTIYQTDFQTRTEFGISSKDLSIELIFSENSPLRINGYTLGHRFQRDL